jgi:molybdopterin-guanine dinucleotide biosynthesis adapter protein
MKVFGLAGYSGAGKTTLIERLLRSYAAQGLSVSIIKHTHHDFDVDRPGKDSFRQREAGANEVMLVCDQRWVLMHELRGQPEPSLAQQLEYLTPCDLVLVEGFKHTEMPKLEVHRPSYGKPLIYPENPWVVAIACDTPLKAPLPVLDLNDVESIAHFILNHVGL